MSLLCGKCDKQFLLKQMYERHITSCHQDSPEYVCKVCRKSFTSKKVLNQHERIHKDISFSCQLCSKSFARKEYLKTHVDSCLFQLNKPESENHGRKLFKCVLHLNAYNI